MVRNTKRNRNNYKKRKIMRGGFNGEEETRLQELGFSQADIDFLEELGLNMNLIETSLNTVNQTTGINWTPQELINDLYNIDNDINSSISSIHSSLGNSYLTDISDLNEDLNGSLNLSNISQESEHNIENENGLLDLSQDSSLHLSDLQGNSSAMTDSPSVNSIDSNVFDYSNNSNNSNNSIDSNNSHETTIEGGKSKKSRKTKKSKKSRKTRKSRR